MIRQMARLCAMTLAVAFNPVVAEYGPGQLARHSVFTALALLVGMSAADRLSI
jgi:hypothetical protein